MGSLGISNHREGHHPPLGGWAPRLGYVWDVGFHNHGDRCSSPKSWGCVIPPQPFMAEIYGLINGADCKHLHPLGQVWALPTVPHESWSSCIWHGIHPFFCIGFLVTFWKMAPRKTSLRKTRLLQVQMGWVAGHYKVPPKWKSRSYTVSVAVPT